MLKLIIITMLAATPALAETTPVKKSNSGICHTPSSPHYDRTQNFIAYPNIDECLANGGRLPKGQRK